MTWWHIILLAVVQGIAEFLPISSSGHLVVIEGLLHVSTDLTALNVILHAGTLGSILVFYRKSIVKLLTEDRRVIGLLAVGTVPAVFVGLTVKVLFDKVLELPILSEILEMPIVVGAMLPVTGLMLLWMAGRDGKMEYGKLTYRQAFIIGLFQAFAILPGISRSGSTILAGLLIGLKRPAAATFSFLLAIPAIGLAAAWETLKLIREPQPHTDMAMLAIGAVLSFVVGLAALWAVVRLLNQGRLYWFAFWCIPLGLAVIVWQVSLWL